eukprot:Selendium_serpulae@DN5901_c0_g1_i10.p1
MKGLARLVWEYRSTIESATLKINFCENCFDVDVESVIAKCPAYVHSCLQEVIEEAYSYIVIDTPLLDTPLAPEDQPVTHVESQSVTPTEDPIPDATGSNSQGGNLASRLPSDNQDLDEESQGFCFTENASEDEAELGLCSRLLAEESSVGNTSPIDDNGVTGGGAIDVSINDRQEAESSGLLKLQEDTGAVEPISSVEPAPHSSSASASASETSSDVQSRQIGSVTQETVFAGHKSPIRGDSFEDLKGQRRVNKKPQMRLNWIATGPRTVLAQIMVI